MMERTHQAIREALSEERLEELAKRQEKTIKTFLEEILDAALFVKQYPHQYTPALLDDAREILDELLHRKNERINIAKIKSKK
jgi:hypothetical protein